MMDRKKLLLLYNPSAGRAQTSRNLDMLLQKFCTGGCETTVYPILDGLNAEDILAGAESAGYDIVVCCGGDGTLHHTVNAMAEAGLALPVGYLPAGSTNDFAASLHLPKDSVAAARVITSGIPTPIDVGQFNERYFVYVASFGAFTQTSYTVPQPLKNALGHTAYMLEAVRQLPSINRSVTLSITADGEDLSGEYLFGSVSNSTSIGGLMKLSPDQVQLDDGKYELLLVKNPKNPLEIQALATALLTQNYGHTGIVYRHVSHVECIPQGELPWTLDGEYAPSAAQVMIDNLHQAVTLMA